MLEKSDKNKPLETYMPKKVVLIHCDKKNNRFVPLGVLCLAESLIRNGCEPIIIDTQCDDVKERFSSIDPINIICVGISTWSGPQILLGIEAAKCVRSISPEIPIVWGGMHPSLLPEQTAESQYVDIVVRGEGEETLVELVKKFEKKENWSDIKGITYKRDGELYSTPDREFINMDSLGIPPYYLLDTNRYNFDQHLIIHTSRGCPHKCIFCYNLAYNKLKWRSMSASKVLNDLEVLIEKFNPKFISTADDNFFVSKRRVKDICEGIIENGYSFKWTATCKADYLSKYDKSFLEIVRKSGCISLYIGGESGSPMMLEYIRKGIKVEQIIKAASKCLEVGIEPIFSFIGGLPPENKKDFELTLNLIEKLWDIGATVNGLFVVTVIPGTSLIEMAQKFGLKSPASLGEWGKWQQYISDETVGAWLNKKRRNELELCAEIIRFIFLTRNFGKGSRKKESLRKTIKHNLARVIIPLLISDGKARIKRHLFYMPLEWWIWKYYKKKVMDFF